MTSSSAPEGHQHPGTRLVTELRLLVDAVADRAGPWLDRLAASSHGGDVGLTGHTATADRLDWCPFCALVSLAKGESPDLAGRTLDRAADLVALLRAVLADRWEPGTPHMPGFAPTPSTGAQEPLPSPPREGRVQHIPVRRTDKPVEPS